MRTLRTHKYYVYMEQAGDSQSLSHAVEIEKAALLYLTALTYYAYTHTHASLQQDS